MDGPPRKGIRAPFSFHCTICFEALNVTTRPPVVLPCGHTYLCEPCSKRLDKCMECRSPLSIDIAAVAAPPQQFSLTPDPYSRNGFSPRRPVARAGTMRSSFRSNSSTPLTPPLPHRPEVQEKKRNLPIPKNHVLMCLIDAVQTRSTGEIKNEGYESGDDDEMVLQGMKVMGSSSGTYCVREPKGLIVHPIPPKHKDCEPIGDNITTLQYGQTVQIFMFENRIATVARGAGYILVDNDSQLVKVGEVIDEACKLEATTRVLAMELQELEKKVGRLRSAHETALSRLNDLLVTTETSDVFGPVPDVTSEQHEDPEESKSSVSDVPPMTPSPTRRREVVRFAEEPRRKVYDSPPPLQASKSYDQQGVSMLDSIPQIEPCRSFENLIRHRPESKSSIFSWPLAFMGSYDDEEGKNENSCSSPPPTPSSPRCDRERAAVSRSTAHIDFASGLSGHRGLAGPTYAQRLSQASREARMERRVRMMSHHSGVL